MKSCKNTTNTLAIEIGKIGWLRKKTVFQNISSHDLLEFPELTEKKRILFLLVYQLSQAVSHLAEIVDIDGNVNLQFVRGQSNILKVQVQLRHISPKKYRCFIKCMPNSVGISGILQYALDCANGNRTIGCCSHVAAIIYYLSHAIYLLKILRPSEILSKMFQESNITPVIDRDSDDD